MKKLLFVAMALSAVAVSNAVVLFDNTGTTNGATVRGAGDSPAGHWTNTNAVGYNINRVSFLGDFNHTSNFNYYLADSAGNVTNQLVVTHAGVGSAIYSAVVNWTVGAGQTFYVGASHDTGTVVYSYQFPVSSSQNGFQALNNGNFVGFNNPGFVGDAGAEMTWRLEGNAVPEPATMAVLGLGAVAAIRRRRSR